VTTYTRTCSVDGCTVNGQMRRGMCETHYRRLMRRGELPPFSAATRCTVENCDHGPPIVHGMCVLHCRRVQNHGTTDLPALPSPSERLAVGLVRMPNGCLEWTGSLDHYGYGQISADGGPTKTHRLAWGLAHPDEPLPPVVRHFVCDNPPCCDPEHLRPGTKAENSADMAAKKRSRNGNEKKTHCSRSHPFDEVNTYVTPAGGRDCRACMKVRAANASSRNKGV